MMKTLTAEEKKQEPVEHALKVRNALAQGNYGRFFKLYQVAPNMAGSLIDVFIDKLRILSLRQLAVGFVATKNFVFSVITLETVYPVNRNCMNE